MTEEIKIKYWSDELNAGLDSIKEAFILINNEIFRMKAEVSTSGTLKYRYKKIVIYYSVLKSKLNVKDKIIQEKLPF